MCVLVRWPPLKLLPPPLRHHNLQASKPVRIFSDCKPAPANTMDFSEHHHEMKCLRVTSCFFRFYIIFHEISPLIYATIITTKGFFLKDYLVPQSNGAEVQKFKRAKDWKCLTVYKFAAEKTRGQGLKVENREWSRTISSFDPKLF